MSSEVGNASGSGSAPQEQGRQRNVCVICQDTLGTEDVTALACAHVFHSECLAKFMDVTGKSMEEACPYRCGQTVDLQLPEEGNLAEENRPEQEQEQASAALLAEAASVAQMATELFV